MTHTLHRTSNIDKMLGINTLDDDIVFLTMSAKGYSNEEGSAEKMRRTLEIASKHNPVNMGDMITGNMLAQDMDEIKNNIRDTSIVHAVFKNIEDASAFAREVKEAELGISLVVSAPFNRSWKIADITGLTGHTIEYSGGVWGKIEKLPPPEVMDFTTMCGHGMISPYLVADIIERVKAGKIEAKNGAIEMGKQCCCGVFNTDRAEKLLKALKDKQ